MSSDHSLSPSRPSTPLGSEHVSQPSSQPFSQDASYRSSIAGQGESERSGTIPEEESECRTTAGRREEEQEDGEEEEEEAMVFAVPPVQHHVMEGDAGMVESFNVAMLLPADKVSAEKAAWLQRKFFSLMEALQRSQKEERDLLVKARELSKKLNEQRKVLEHADDFPDNANTEAGRLRKQLLQCENDLAQSTERMEQLEYEMRLLTEEKKEVESEIQRQPKAEDAEQKVRELTNEVEELQFSVKKGWEDVTQLKDEMVTQQKKVDQLKTELADLDKAENSLKDGLVKVRSEPQALSKEFEAMKKEMVGIENAKSEKEKQLKEMEQGISELGQTVHDLVLSKARHDKGSMEAKKSAEKMQYDLERLKKDADTEKEREATLLEERATHELQLRHRVGEWKSLHEAVSSRLKEKNRSMKLAKAGELQLRVLHEAVEQQTTVLGGLQEKREMSVALVNENRVRLEDVRGDLDQIRHWVATQAGLEDAERSKVERQVEAEHRLKAQVKVWQGKLADIKKEMVSRTKEKDREAKELQKAESARWRVADTLKSKQNLLEENAKTLSHLEGKLKGFSSAYELVKSEKNKIVTLIQHASQLAAELQEKVRVLENEIEILRTSVENKERLLQKCALVQGHKVMERDTLRQDFGKQVHMQTELSAELEQQRGAISRLLTKINEAEAMMNQLRKRYESAVEERNSHGLSLIERNEELSIFYEKLNLQDTIIQKANLELNCREDDIHFLKMEIAELKRAIAVGRKKVKERRAVEEQLVQRQIELLEVHEILCALEKKVESPHNSRIRPLSGADMSHTQFQLKIEDLEGRVANVEERLLEKELLHDQVRQITARLESKTRTLKPSSLSVAEKVATYKSKIDETTRKMMALVSELSMQQATARQLQQSVCEYEAKLEKAYTRMQSGEAPTDDTDEEWRRMLRLQETKQRDDEMRRQTAVLEEHFTLPDGTVTLAEPRPNAYVPQTDTELPLPKPYGSQAPFKPSQPGATMRHIRKPVPKPIDI